MIKNFYHYGGQLKPNMPSYVKRGADDRLYELLKQNHFCYVFNCRQMGKSSLQTQIKMRLEATNAQKTQCVYLTLQDRGSGQSITENQWYRDFSQQIFSIFYYSLFITIYKPINAQITFLKSCSSFLF